MPLARRKGHHSLAKERTRAADRVHCHRGIAADCCSIPKLTITVVSPSINTPLTGQCQGVIATAHDLHDGFACQHTFLINRRRCLARPRGVVSKLAAVVFTPGSQPGMRPEQHQVIAIAAIIPGDERIGDAVETQINHRAVGHVAEGTLDEGCAGVLHHGQIRAGHGREIECEIRIS